MRIILKILLIGLIIGLQACAKEKTPIPERPEALGNESLQFSIPKTERWVMQNGLVVHYLEDKELPLMAGKIYFPGGALFDPAQMAGLAAVTGEQLREGSIPGMSPEDLDKKLDNLAASIETGFSADHGALSFSCLAEDIKTVLGISAEILKNPQFNQARFELWKKLSAEAIKRRRDDPETMASMAVNQLIYGENTPFSSYLSEASLSRISVEDMKEFAERFVRPNGAVLSASGWLPKDKFESLLNELLGDWKSKEEALPPLPVVRARSKPGVYVLERDFQQSTVIVSKLGPPRYTPDIYEINIYNRVLGAAGFGSRLFDEIRTKLGLAYDVSGGIFPGTVAGSVSLSLGTRNEAVMDALERALAIVDDTLLTLPAQESFLDAKSAVERSFAFRFESTKEVVSRAAQLEFFGYPQDYDKTYLDRIHAVTPEMVREAGQRWVKPREFVTVIVGTIKAKDVANRLADKKIPVYSLKFDTEPRVVSRVMPERRFKLLRQ